MHPDFPSADDLIAAVRDIGERCATVTATSDQLQAEHDRTVEAVRLLVVGCAVTTIVVLLLTYRMHKLWGTVAHAG